MKLREQVVVVARRRRPAQNTIDVYCLWIRQFLTFSARRHGAWKTPAQLGTGDVEAFLNDLVIVRRMSASAQNQALCALAFLYGRVLEDVIPQDHLGKFLLQRSRRPKRIPTVLSADEVRRLIEAVDPNRISRLMIELLYATVLRSFRDCEGLGSGRSGIIPEGRTLRGRQLRGLPSGRQRRSASIFWGGDRGLGRCVGREGSSGTGGADKNGPAAGGRGPSRKIRRRGPGNRGGRARRGCVLPGEWV